MFVVISGTNRPNNRTQHVARLAVNALEAQNVETKLLDLQELPPALFLPESYAEKPAEFAPWQDAISTATGVLTVVPEYNGAAPGALKYFVDMLKFPETLVGMPCAFIGLAAGQWGALRAVEHLEMVYQYRQAHLYGTRLFIANLYSVLNDKGQLTDDTLAQRLRELAAGFVTFAKRLQEPETDSAEWTQ